jgi:hypothetical protein
MGDAAQGESRKHPVFTTPFEVKPVYESWKTPDNYRGYPGGKELPKELKVWRIQNTGKSYGGVATFSYGFEDSPDAEILTPGYNVGKESGAVGVGRQGNILQWGFSAPPSQMTDAGKRFFLNCLCYIRQFDGQPPLFRLRASDRLDAVRLSMLVGRIQDPKFAPGQFSADLLTKYKGKPEALAAYYQEHLELVYRDKVFLVDEELARLGLKSNRKLETLEKLIALLNDSEHSATARKLLTRYTTQTFETAAQWQSWLHEHREQIYFTDRGGYKFLVCPKEYLQMRGQAPEFGPKEPKH